MKKEPISVLELTNSISYLLKDGIGIVSVVGEISNYKLHSSGHRYFSLKDENAQISAVLWKTRIVTFVPVEGMKVIVTGQISVYPPRGQYQLDCMTIEQVGKGNLYFAYEELKQKLKSIGYFDKENKKEIPKFPLKIGVITSPTGAAIQDILSTIERRMPIATIFFRPTEVQGDRSSKDIAMAINELDSKKLDVIICGRGGGSIEDLWSFNTEIVANAIYNCNTPIISAVGHETDFTIADFVADLRAATPTAAAELVTPIIKNDLNNFINNNITNITFSLKSNINSLRDQIDTLIGSYSFRKIIDNFNIEKQRLDENTNYLKKVILQNLNLQKNNITNFSKLLNSLYPLNPLKKGFAILKSNNKILNNSETLNSFDKIEIERFLEKAEVKIINVNIK